MTDLHPISPESEPDTAPPRHIAIIMDGNGRWAQAQGLPRTAGHRAGMEALRRTIRNCQHLKIGGLTVYSFSTENWQRPAAEIEALFALMRLYIKNDLDTLIKEGVKIRVIGSRKGLEPGIIKMIETAEHRSRHGTGLTLNIAFNYGGRAEIVEAARMLAMRVRDGEVKAESLDEAEFGRCLWSSDMPEPDMIIRTSGESRLSNFLLWGAAYAELVFIDVLWPDFGEGHLQQAINAFHNRNRRFGTLKAAQI